MTILVRRRARLFCCLTSLLLAASLTFAAQPSKTLITDTLYRADGSPAAGTLLISWPAFTAGEGKAVAAGSLTVPIGAQGAVSLELVPTQNATPAGTYYRVTVKLDDGTSTTEYWTVPAQSPATIAAIRSSVVPASVALQVASREYVDSSFLRKSGDETIAGVKTFASSPLVPTPAGDTAAANKQYVDAAVSATNPSILTISKGGTGTNAFTAARCVRVAADGSKLESSAADCNTASDADTVDGQHAAQLGSGGGGGAALHAIKDCALPTDGTTNIVPALAACESAHAAATIAFPAGSYRVAASHVVPGSVAVDAVAGAQFNVDAGATLTVEGEFSGSPTQHFTGPGTVKLAGTGRIRPEWYGAVRSTTVDSSAAIQAAVRANPGKTFVFTKWNPFTSTFVGEGGTMAIDYYVANPITLDDQGDTLVCESWNGGNFNTNNNCSIRIGPGLDYGFWFKSHCFGCGVRGINFVGSYLAISEPRSWLPTLTYDNVRITGPYFHCTDSDSMYAGRHGWYLEGNQVLDGGLADHWQFNGCAAIDNQQDGFYLHGADANQGSNISFNAYGNNHLGIQDDSQLGNIHLGPHSNSNGEKMTWSATNIASARCAANVVTITLSSPLEDENAPQAGNAMRVLGIAGLGNPNGTFLANDGATQTSFSYNQACTDGTVSNSGTARFAFLDEIAAAFWNEGSGNGYIGAYAATSGGTWIQPYTEMNQGDGVHGCVNFPNGASVLFPHFGCGQNSPTSVAPEYTGGASHITFNNTNGFNLYGGTNAVAGIDIYPGLTTDQPAAIGFGGHDRSTLFWYIQCDPTNNCQWVDATTNVHRLLMHTPGSSGNTDINSEGAGIVHFNFDNNSGTGGIDLYSGGASPTGPVWKVTNAGNVTGRSFTSTVATGTAPFPATSTTVNPNLNADLLDGKHAADMLSAADKGIANGVATLDAGAHVTPAQLPPGWNVRTCEVHVSGSGPGGVLQDSDDEAASCYNDYGGTLTITAVRCYADAGTPTVTPIRTGGAANSILTAPLTCGSAAWNPGTLNGTPTLAVGSTIDANITTAGGTAKNLRIVITFTL